MSPMEKNLGHLSLIMYSFNKSDPEKAKYWQLECQKYWKNYVKWHRDTVLAKDSMWNTINSVIDMEDFSSLQLVGN